MHAHALLVFLLTGRVQGVPWGLTASSASLRPQLATCVPRRLRATSPVAEPRSRARYGECKALHTSPSACWSHSAPSSPRASTATARPSTQLSPPPPWGLAANIRRGRAPGSTLHAEHQGGGRLLPLMDVRPCSDPPPNTPTLEPPTPTPAATSFSAETHGAQKGLDRSLPPISWCSHPPEKCSWDGRRPRQGSLASHAVTIPLHLVFEELIK
ncbi:hypothetical protein KIL84_016237 [Mauremys mutica]|uniref:Uncharacterized protein n=1 Tax=Mauremys mutica TaxID=74926 RepID=A0A9D3WUK3_9SAUR|nr:hypothetical protein KIL84_016237 [Mauremys mutica]